MFCSRMEKHTTPPLATKTPELNAQKTPSQPGRGRRKHAKGVSSVRPGLSVMQFVSLSRRAWCSRPRRRRFTAR